MSANSKNLLQDFKFQDQTIPQLKVQAAAFIDSLAAYRIAEDKQNQQKIRQLKVQLQQSERQVKTINSQLNQKKKVLENEQEKERKIREKKAASGVKDTETLIFEAEKELKTLRDNNSNLRNEMEATAMKAGIKKDAFNMKYVVPQPCHTIGDGKIAKLPVGGAENYLIKTGSHGLIQSSHWKPSRIYIEYGAYLTIGESSFGGRAGKGWVSTVWIAPGATLRLINGDISTPNHTVDFFAMKGSRIEVTPGTKLAPGLHIYYEDPSQQLVNLKAPNPLNKVKCEFKTLDQVTIQTTFN